jgi:sugar (pentulose or hexulose) kinase
LTTGTVAGVDVGTTHLRVGFWTSQGKPEFLAVRPTPYATDRSGSRGLDLVAVASQVADLLSAGVQAVGRPPAALGIASMAEVGVPLDAANMPMTLAVPWTAAPGADEADLLVQRYGGPALYRTTGLHPEPKHTLATWMWLRRERPGLLAEMHRWAGVADTVAATLTGEVGTVASLACRTLAYDLDARRWNPELLSAAGVRPDQLPSILAAGEPAGTITRAAADRTRLLAGTPVVVSGHDHPVGAWGAGVRTAGQLADSAGTAEVALAPAGDQQPTERLRERGFTVGCFVDDRQQYVLGGLSSGGAMTDWLASLLGLPADEQRYVTLAALLAHAGAGPGELVIEPYPAGRKAPAPEPRRRLAIHGLGLNNTPADLVVALMEATACHIRWTIEELAATTGIPPQAVTLYGGALRLPGWAERRAAVYPWVTLAAPHPEAVSLGAASLAAAAGGTCVELVPGAPVAVSDAQRRTHDLFYQQRFLAAVR